MNAATKSNSLSIDLLTILAIGIILFILKNVIHEALGHGSVCLLAGGTPLVLSSAHFDCDTASVSIVAVVLAIFHIFVLGPGVEF